MRRPGLPALVPCQLSSVQPRRLFSERAVCRELGRGAGSRSCGWVRATGGEVTCHPVIFSSLVQLSQPSSMLLRQSYLSYQFLCGRAMSSPIGFPRAGFFPMYTPRSRFISCRPWCWHRGPGTTNFSFLTSPCHGLAPSWGSLQWHTILV